MAGRKKNANPAPEAITQQWLDGLLERKLLPMLETVGRNQAQLVAEFVKLAMLDRRLNPPKKKDPVVIWKDFVDQDGNQIRR